MFTAVRGVLTCGRDGEWVAFTAAGGEGCVYKEVFTTVQGGERVNSGAGVMVYKGVGQA